MPWLSAISNLVHYGHRGQVTDTMIDVEAVGSRRQWRAASVDRPGLRK